MKIEIKQKKFSLFRSHYDIYINGKLSYKAKSKFYLFIPKIEFYDLESKNIALLKKKFTLLNQEEWLNHEMILSKDEKLTLSTESFIAHNLILKNEKISFYEQKGNDIGIFIENTQVGIINRNKKKKLSGDIYKIEVNNKIKNPFYVIGFVIAYDYEFKNENDAYITVDYGNRMIKPVKEISKNWK
jgi:hypothetical protein